MYTILSSTSTVCVAIASSVLPGALQARARRTRGGDLGRGAWLLEAPLSKSIFSDGFASGDTAAWIFTSP